MLVRLDHGCWPSTDIKVIQFMIHHYLVHVITSLRFYISNMTGGSLGTRRHNGLLFLEILLKLNVFLGLELVLLVLDINMIKLIRFKVSGKVIHHFLFGPQRSHMWLKSQCMVLRSASHHRLLISHECFIGGAWFVAWVVPICPRPIYSLYLLRAQQVSGTSEFLLDAEHFYMLAMCIHRS